MMAYRIKGNHYMMQRRKFLVLSSLLSVSPYIEAKQFTAFEKEFKEVEAIIFAVQKHMFPNKNKLPSAKRMKVNDFLLDTMLHKSFDKDIRVFVLEGAQTFDKREKGLFLSMTTVEKEKSLRAYENTSYGSAWLSRIMTLTMEGLFSDPIYGANIKEAGWKSLESYGGVPKPTKKYLGLSYV
jgi:hypothetical protein